MKHEQEQQNEKKWSVHCVHDLIIKSLSVLSDCVSISFSLRRGRRHCCEQVLKISIAFQSTQATVCYK